MVFQGFGPNALPFFKALAFHQTKAWFEANRDVYEREIKGPMGDLVEETVARLAKARVPLKGDRKSSVFRIHRDVRFSNSKEPYKTNAGAALTRTGNKTEPGVLYFHLSPEECFFACGFHMPDPHELARLRAAAVRRAKTFKQMTRKLASMDLSLSKESALKRPPRGLDGIDDPEIALAARLKSFVCVRPVSEARISEPALVDEFCTFASESLPLLKWGWNALAEKR